MTNAQTREHWQKPENAKKLRLTIRLAEDLAHTMDDRVNVYVCGANIFVRQPRFTFFDSDNVRRDSIIVAQIHPGGRADILPLDKAEEVSPLQW